MNLDTIQAFVANPPPTHLNTVLAVGFVLSVLLQQDTYSTALLQRLGQEYPAYCLSDTILDKALTFLETEGTVLSYWQKGGDGDEHAGCLPWHPNSEHRQPPWCNSGTCTWHNTRPLVV